MTQSRTLQLHIEQLKDIRSILHSLRNMAFMEIHKLSQYQQAQDRVVRHIETVMADFLQFYPGLPKVDANSPSIVIVVGSERGFCGNFNESLIEQLTELSPSQIIAIGNRLCNCLNQAQISFSAVPGANGGDEIKEVLSQLIDALGELRYQQTLCKLSALYHHGEHAGIIQRPLLPPATAERHSEHRIEPLLNLQPPQFLFELVDHYLFSSLQDVLYASYAAENNQRLQHLDNAVNHLDEETARLSKISQIYRQEEITEEIEVILLNAQPPSQ
ncbi:F0F1 ATP synthase subunit gamma [Methylomarinum sp. Ch1-1]|uniref:F0F1 ATP synthase subunit gamma n=1 Tax=Methylomarinum roseum TaxID=3067653 RepID=A0AAU7NZB1_9GAMM|nr:F0F1 ATP synthase subunit gamma [Methylomarinum sp. Ch1-1]MDP4521543.1 F0F1 ATP synthase subunit gamma [Methylomarinum sp. Ch1-1]